MRKEQGLAIGAVELILGNLGLLETHITTRKNIIL